LPDTSIQLACQGIVDDEDHDAIEEDSKDEEESFLNIQASFLHGA
jgi:hypothetical protein